MKVGENVQDQELNKQEAMIASLSRQLSIVRIWFVSLVMIVVFTSIAFGKRYAEIFSFYESSLENYHMISLYLQDLDSNLKEQMECIQKIDEIVRQ